MNKCKLKYKKLNTVRPTFKVEFKETTKKILIVFCKKNYLEVYPIIASTVFYLAFLKKNNFDFKKVNLFEPIKYKKENYQQTETPRIMGSADIYFGVCEKKCVNSSKKNSIKIVKAKKKTNICF